MSFLFPLYLLGALALSLPVILHLKKKPSREKIPFGSLMFLEKSPERLTRRTRIERWILLALRCLALLALALVFGRPFFRTDPRPGDIPDASIAVILVDRSASMQREDLAAKAIAEAEKSVQARGAGDDLALLFFDRAATTVAGFDDWRNLAPQARIADLKKRIENLPNGWDRSHPGAALVTAADLIASRAGEKPYRSREIVLISDFKQGAEFDALNEVAWPENVKVQCVPIAPRKRGNLTMALAASTRESRAASELVHRVRIENGAESESDRFELSWKGDPESKVSGVIPPGSSRVIQVPTAKKAGLSELVIRGDAHEYDNRVFIAPPSPRPLNIAFFSDQSSAFGEAGSPDFYLERALQPTASLVPSLSRSAFPELAASTAAVLILHGKWSAEDARIARKAAENGRLIIALPAAGMDPQAIATLLDSPSLTLKESEKGHYAMLASLDFEHPVLAPFARAGIRDFTKVRFWRHRQLDFAGGPIPLGLSVLAKFDSGSPAWISGPAGDGQVFVFLSGWEPAESQFALSSKFVPVLYSIFENAGYSARAAPAFVVGEVEVEEAGGQRFMAPRPGLYTARFEGSAEPVTVGVNLHPAEGRTDPVDSALVLAGFNVPLHSDAATKQEARQADPAALQRIEKEEKEAAQKLWRWFALAVLFFLLSETWLSGRNPANASPATASPS